MKLKLLLAVLVLVLTTQGFECINEDLLVSIDVKGITGTYDVNPGDGLFGPPSDCVTFTAADYLDADFTNIKDVRIYDIKVSTLGTYGTVNSATLTVNGTPILTLVGGTAWSYFSTPRSILTDSKINKNLAGITALVNALRNKQSIQICGQGSVGPAPVPTGLAVKVEVYGQVDANP